MRTRSAAIVTVFRRKLLQMLPAFVLACLGFQVTAAEARNAIYNLDIPAQSLNDALQALALASQHKLLYSSELVDGKSSPALKGEFTTEQAVQWLLSGTDLVYEVNDGLVLIRAQEGKLPAALTGKTEAPDDKRGVWLAQGAASAEASKVETRSQSSETSAKGGEQDFPVKLEEIVVTAQKKSEHLQDVPVPVTVISTESLIASNQLTIREFFQNVPGLNVAGTEVGQTQIAIRGLTTGGDFYTPTVGLVIDDVPYGPSTAAARGYSFPQIDPSDLSDIEVLRGPQGTLYGTSSIGGLIKYVTKDPSTQGFSGRLQLGASGVAESDDVGHTLRASVNIPLGETLALRASAYSLKEPGYLDNVETGKKDVNSRRDDGGRVSALWAPSQDFSLKLSAMLQHSDLQGTSCTCQYPVPSGKGDLETRFLPDTGFFDERLQAYSATVSAKLRSVDFTSLTGYNKREVNSRTSIEYGGNPWWIPFPEGTSKFSQEFRLASRIGSRVDWRIGTFYTDENAAYHGGIFEQDPITLESTQFFFNAFAGGYKEYAAFGDVLVHLTDRFSVDVGGRTSHIKQTYHSEVEIPRFGVPLSIVDLKSQEDAFTYLLTPQYKFSQNLMVYARLASGYRAGGTNTRSFPSEVGVVPDTFDPDKSLNYEIGVKGSALNEALAFDASVYSIDWKDIQLSAAHEVSGIDFGYTANAGRAKSQGIELSLEARPLRSTSIATWVAWSDAKITDPFPPDVTLPAKPGDRLPFSPRWSGQVSLDQKFSLTESLAGYVGTSVSYVGERQAGFSFGDVPRVSLPAYTQVDFRAGFNVASWDINAYMTNVTDRRGLLASGITGLPSQPIATQRVFIRPRSFGLMISRDF